KFLAILSGFLLPLLFTLTSLTTVKVPSNLVGLPPSTFNAHIPHYRGLAHTLLIFRGLLLSIALVLLVAALSLLLLLSFALALLAAAASL
ncbi:unnamed protein product, partial [Closterium sp. Naga37s-1]